MTSKIAMQYKRQIATFTCIILCVTMLCFSKDMKLGALEGMRLSSEILIPTLFPFFILSDYWSKNFSISEKSVLSIITSLSKFSCHIHTFFQNFSCTEKSGLDRVFGE